MARGLFEAFEKGGETVVMLDPQGNVNEGPGFNIFAVTDGRVVTPASGVLEGITRKAVLELCEELEIDAALDYAPRGRVDQRRRNLYHQHCRRVDVDYAHQ